MHQVRKWHFSDAPPAAANDRFRRKSGPRKFHVQRGEQCCCCSWNDGFGMSALEVRADAASKSAVSQERCRRPCRMPKPLIWNLKTTGCGNRICRKLALRKGIPCKFDS
jgi:hypothetical protein